MTLAEILADDSLRHHEFPVTKNNVYLAHAGVCPLPRRVADAISQYLTQSTLEDQEHFIAAALTRQTRQLAARLIQAGPDEIALVGPTSLALSFVAAGLKFKKNDNIIVYYDDYPSNVYPWMALANQGVQVRFLNTRALGQIRPVDVMGQVDEQTRIVSLASAHFVSGFRLDLAAIGQFLRERNILFCLDAIQTLGAFPISAQYVDFLAADAHKWLLGPCAAGILYVRKELQEELTPPIYGWNNVRCPNYVAQPDIQLRPDARRYEAGTHNLLGLAGLKASLELLLECGIDSISAELLRKRALLLPALQEKGFSVLHADSAPANSSGIISFTHPDRDPSKLHQKLTDARVITSLRSDRSGRKYIRLSPHFYNSDSELHRLLDLL